MNPKTNQTIFLTGGTGFIGRNIVEQLGQKYKIFSPSHHELDLVDLDAVKSFLSKNTIDVVIHSANVGGNRKDLSVENTTEKNLRMFFNLVNCRQFYKKMIFLGSGAEYGKQRGICEVEEGEFGEVVPLDSYGFAKFICGQFIEKSDFVVNLRCFGVYGKYEDYLQRFISQSIVRVLKGEQIVIQKNVFFDYLYINDLVKIIDHFIGNSSKYKSYNTVSGKKIDLESLAKLIEKLGGSKKSFSVMNPGLNNEYTASNQRLLSELGDFKFTSHEQAILEMFSWYKSIPL